MPSRTQSGFSSEKYRRAIARPGLFLGPRFRLPIIQSVSTTVILENAVPIGTAFFCARVFEAGLLSNIVGGASSLAAFRAHFQAGKRVDTRFASSMVIESLDCHPDNTPRRKGLAEPAFFLFPAGGGGPAMIVDPAMIRRRV
ncbi:MAG: hypothetical protein ACF788_01145 [Novipirellula sp. JB048]